MYGSIQEEKAIEDAILADSLPQFSAALEHAVDCLGSDISASLELMASVLQSAVHKGRTALVEHVLSEGADISALTVLDVGRKPSIALWSVLKSYDFDFNQAGEKNSLAQGKSVIYKVTHSEKLVRWLLDECGVRVDLGEEDYWFKPQPPLLLQMCASLGSVACFKLIKERGAKVGRRTLHAAVKSAAEKDCDPDNTSYDPKLFTKTILGEDIEKDREEGAEYGLEDLPLGEHLKNREEMLRYLVDELHLDVNVIDTEDVEDDGCRKPSFIGRPLDYATSEAGEHGGATVVRWLLKKGADPNITLRKFDPADWTE